MSLCDVSSDGGSIGKVNDGEKECILTQMTKKIGLGIYTRRRNAAVRHDRAGKEADLDGEGDERETWYMFYPPPPSPSLALNPQEWGSASSTEIEPKSPTGFDFQFKATAEKETSSIHSVASEESSYKVSGMSSPAEDNPGVTVDSRAVDIDAFVHSAEDLANQYRDLVHPTALSAASLSRSSSHAHSIRDVSSIPLPLAIAFDVPLPLPLPLPMPTPKTLRKVKRQHSLRRLNDPNPEQFADYDFNPDLLIPEENGSPQVAPRTPSPPLLSLSPDDVPSPNEPDWIMAPFSPAEAKNSPSTGKKRRSPQIQPPTPPPRESSKQSRHSRKNGLDKYETGEIPPRPSRRPKIRPPIVRRNASFTGWADATTFESESSLAIKAAVSPPPQPPASLPSPPLSPLLSRSKSFVLPSVVLKRQWEDAFQGLPQPQPQPLPQAREHQGAYVVVEQSSKGRRRAREKRYGIVVPRLDVDANVNAVENGGAGWV